MKKIHPDHLIGLFCIALAVVIYAVSAGFPSLATGASELTGPAFYPRALALVLIFCGVLQVISGFRNLNADSVPGLEKLRVALSSSGAVNILMVCGAVLFFIYALEDVGFLVTTSLLLCTLMWRFGVPWKQNLFYSAVLVTVLYLVFGKLFTVDLPNGILDYFGRNGLSE